MSPDSTLFNAEELEGPETLPVPVELQEHPLAAPTRDISPMALMQQAIERGIDPAGLVTLSELAKTWEDRRSAREFADLFRQFQAECPRIVKRRQVNVATKGGSSYSYNFAPLEDIAEIVDPILQSLGFSYSWDSREEGGRMIVSCILRHDNGHRETSTFIAPMASGSPTMSEIQKHASSMSYAKRQSLVAVLGITTADTDTDATDPTTVTPGQAAELLDLADAGGADHGKFLAWIGAEAFEEVLASQYDTAKAALKRKVAQA